MDISFGVLGTELNFQTHVYWLYFFREVFLRSKEELLRGSTISYKKLFSPEKMGSKEYKYILCSV